MRSFDPFYRIFPVGLLLVFGVTSGCIDEISLDTSAPAPPPLSVFGSVSNGPGPHEVVLRRAAAFEQSLEGNATPITSAEVVLVEEETGTRATMSHRGSGRYKTDEGAIVGAPGRTYHIEIALADDKVFRSRPETMPEPVAIDSLFVTPDTTEDVAQLEVRSQFDDPEGDPGYYRWSTRATFQAPFLPAPLNPPYYCWGDDGVGTDVAVANDRFFDGKVRSGELVRSIPVTEKTSSAYQLDVQQRTLTEDAHQFWKLIETQIEETGTPFSPPPSAIDGNIVNVGNPDAPAFGYFSAVGQSNETFCLNAGNYPSVPLQSYSPLNDCGSRSALSTERPPYWECSSNRNP